jgi:thioredoxin reductase (NADPH)
MEEASFLSRYASKVYIIHRFDYLEASKVMQKRVLGNPKIEVSSKEVRAHRCQVLQGGGLGRGFTLLSSLRCTVQGQVQRPVLGDLYTVESHTL